MSLICLHSRPVSMTTVDRHFAAAKLDNQANLCEGCLFALGSTSKAMRKVKRVISTRTTWSKGRASVESLSAALPLDSATRVPVVSLVRTASPDRSSGHVRVSGSTKL